MDTKEKDAMDTDANAEVESSDSEDDAVEEGKSNKQQADDDDEPPEEAANSDPVADPRNLKPFTGDSLPYDLSSLSWDASHRRNKQNKYCYCGNPRTQWTVMLKCASCKQLFHIECLKKRPAHPPLPGEGAYTFKCCICTKSDAEYCELLGKSWTDVVRVAIYNLLLQEKRKGNANLRKFFQYKEEICNFIDKHWDQLCHGKTRTKTWENTIGSSLSTKSHYFASGAEVLGQAGFWGLKSDSDPSSFTKSGSSASVKKDKSKKKLPKGVKKKRGNDALSFLPEDLPSRPPKVRKPSSSAAPAAAPVMLPKQFFDAKSYGYTKAVLAKENSALQVKIANDQLTVTNEKGYRMARASAGVTEGAWYFEIECLPHNGNTRLGWCTEKGDVQAPVGFDIYSYSYRDKLGTKFHQSRGREYGDGYGPGDTLGFYINLPPKKENANVHQKDSQPQVIVAPSGKKQQEPDRLIGSEIIFFKNGANQGIAFSNIYEGTYYPAASLYMGGTVKFNFGPNFKYPPKDIKYRPLCELEEEMKAAVAEAARVAKQEAAAQVAAQAAAQAAQAAPAPEGSANNNNAETNGAHQAAQPAAAPAEVKS